MKDFASESFIAMGHKNIRATHETTFEITKEDFLTSRGSCIIGITAEKACSDLSKDLKISLRSDLARVVLKLASGEERDEVVAWGSRRITLESPVSMVIRRSTYVCGRTLAIRANKAARDLDEDLVENLRRGKNLQISINVSSTTAIPST